MYEAILKILYASPWYSRGISLLISILKPIVFILNILTGIIVKLFGGEASTSPTLTEEELKTIVDVSEEEGVLENTEKEMIFNVFKFGDIQVEDIMIQRVNITALNKDITKEELLDIVYLSLLIKENLKRTISI